MTEPNGGALTRREEFGATQEVARITETSAAAVAAQAKAAVEARFIVAMRLQRDTEEFRVRVLKECRRVGFAERARYRKPVGRELNKATGQWEQNYAEGFSIRFVEAAIQAYRNTNVETCTIYDSAELRIVRVNVLDLETNVAFSQDVTVGKTVERKGDRDGKPPKGRTVISERLNSANEKTFTVLATEDEVRVKTAAEVSKAIRTNGLRLLPPDILDDCLRQIEQTLSADTQADPDAAKRKIIDAFAALSIMPVDLQLYLGKPVDRCTPADLVGLRKVYAALQAGEMTWDDAMANAASQGSEDMRQDAIRRRMDEETAKAAHQNRGHGPAASGQEHPATEAASDEPPSAEQGETNAPAPSTQRRISLGGKRS